MKKSFFRVTELARLNQFRQMIFVGKVSEVAPMAPQIRRIEHSRFPTHKLPQTPIR